MTIGYHDHGYPITNSIKWWKEYKKTSKTQQNHIKSIIVNSVVTIRQVRNHASTRLVEHLSGFNPSLVCHHITVLIRIDFFSQFDVREDEEQNVKLGQTIDLLLAAGYFRARIKGLSPFDKVCINVLQHNDIHSLMYINVHYTWTCNKRLHVHIWLMLCSVFIVFSTRQ